MALQLVGRYELNQPVGVVEASSTGLGFITSITLPNDNTKVYAFSVICTNVRKDLVAKSEVSSQNLVFRYSNPDGQAAGVGGGPEFVHLMPASVRSFVYRSGVFLISNGGLLEPEGLYIGPGNVTPRDDFFYTATEVCVWSANSSGEFDTDLWAEGITALSYATPADQTAVIDKLDQIILYHTNGVVVGGYKSGVAPDTDPTVVAVAEKLNGMIEGAGASARFDAYALSLSATADLTATNAAIAAIPTDTLLADDPRLDNLDAPISMPVIVGGYLPGQSPSGVDYTSRFDDIDNAISNIPTNPVLVTDTRLNGITVGGYASGQSPANLVDLSALATAIGAIPTTPLLTNDARLNNLANLDAAVSSVGGTDWGTRFDAVDSAVAAIPTNPLLTVDARLNNLDATVSSRLATVGYTAPDNAGITAAQSAAETVRDLRSLASADYGTAANQTSILAQLGAVQAGVSSRLSVLTSDQYVVPSVGSTDYSIVIQSNDAAGQPINLDSDALPTIVAFAGAVDRSANLSVVTKDSTGRYRVTYSVDNAANEPESIILTATGTQGSTTYNAEAVVTISDTGITDYTLADRSRDDAIKTALDAVSAALPGLSTFDHSTDFVTVGGYDSGQSPADLAPTPDLSSVTAAIGAVQTAVNGIPTNPLLTDDTRIDDLSTFDHTTNEVKIDLTQQLSNSNTIDEALIQLVGTGGGAYTLTVEVEDENNTPVPYVYVDLLDDQGDRLGIWAQADASGQLEFSLDAGDYELTIRSTPGLSLASPLAVNLSGDQTETLSLTRTVTNLPAVAGMCVIEDYVLDSAFDPVEGVIVSATVDSVAVLSAVGIATRIVATATSDATGLFQLRLPRRTEFSKGGIYTITFSGAGSGNIYRTVTGFIPDAATCILKDIEGVVV